MFNGFVSSILTFLLDRYIKPLKKKQMDVEILNSKTTLVDLEVKGDAFISEGIPLIITKGSIKYVCLVFPIFKISSQATTLNIDDINLKSKFDWDFFENVVLTESSIDLLFLKKKSKKNGGEKFENSKTFLGIMDKIINKLKVSINKINFTIEVKDSDNVNVIGIKIDSIDIGTVERGNNSEDSITKFITIKGVKLFFDIIKKSELESYYESVERNNVMNLDIIESQFEHFRCLDTPVSNFLQMNIPEIIFNFSYKQIVSIKSIIDNIRKMYIRNKYTLCYHNIGQIDSHKRIWILVDNSARLKNLKYSININLAIEFLKNRKTYSSLYTKNLESTNSFFRNSNSSFDQLTKSLSIPCLKLLNNYANKQYIKKVRSERKMEADIHEFIDVDYDIDNIIKTFSAFRLDVTIVRIVLNLEDSVSDNIFNYRVFNLFTQVCFTKDLKQLTFSISNIDACIGTKQFLHIQEYNSKSKFLLLTCLIEDNLKKVEFYQEKICISLSLDQIHILSLFSYIFSINFAFLSVFNIDFFRILMIIYTNEYWDISIKLKGFDVKIFRDGSLQNSIAQAMIGNITIINNDNSNIRGDNQVYFTVDASIDSVSYEDLKIVSGTSIFVKLISNYDKINDLFDSIIELKFGDISVVMSDSLLHYGSICIRNLLKCVFTQRIIRTIKVFFIHLCKVLNFRRKTNITIDFGKTTLSIFELSIHYDNFVFNAKEYYNQTFVFTLELCNIMIEYLTKNINKRFSSVPILEMANLHFKFEDNNFMLDIPKTCFRFSTVILSHFKVKLTQNEIISLIFEDIPELLSSDVLDFLLPFNFVMNDTNICFEWISNSLNEILISFGLESCQLRIDFSRAVLVANMLNFVIDNELGSIANLAEMCYFIHIGTNECFFSEEFKKIASLDVLNLISYKSMSEIKGKGILIGTHIKNFSLYYSHSLFDKMSKTLVELSNTFIQTCDHIKFVVSPSIRFEVHEFSLTFFDFTLDIHFDEFLLILSHTKKLVELSNLQISGTSQIHVIKCHNKQLITSTFIDNVFSIKINQTDINLSIDLFQEFILYFSKSPLLLVHFNFSRYIALDFDFSNFEIDVGCINFRLYSFSGYKSLETVSFSTRFYILHRVKKLNFQGIIKNIVIQAKNDDSTRILEMFSLSVGIDMLERMIINIDIENDHTVIFTLTEIKLLMKLFGIKNWRSNFPQIGIDISKTFLKKFANPLVHLSINDIVFKICSGNRKNFVPLITVMLKHLTLSQSDSSLATTYNFSFQFLLLIRNRQTWLLNSVIERNNLNFLITVTVDSLEMVAFTSKPLDINIVMSDINEILYCIKSLESEAVDLDISKFYIVSFIKEKINVITKDNSILEYEQMIGITDSSLYCKVKINDSIYTISPYMYFPYRLNNNIIVDIERKTIPIIHICYINYIKNSTDFIVSLYGKTKEGIIKLTDINSGSIFSLPNSVKYILIAESCLVDPHDKFLFNINDIGSDNEIKVPTRNGICYCRFISLEYCFNLTYSVYIHNRTNSTLSILMNNHKYTLICNEEKYLIGASSSSRMQKININGTDNEINLKTCDIHKLRTIDSNFGLKITERHNKRVLNIFVPLVITNKSKFDIRLVDYRHTLLSGTTFNAFFEDLNISFNNMVRKIDLSESETLLKYPLNIGASIYIVTILQRQHGTFSTTFVLTFCDYIRFDNQLKFPIFVETHENYKVRVEASVVTSFNSVCSNMLINIYIGDRSIRIHLDMPNEYSYQVNIDSGPIYIDVLIQKSSYYTITVKQRRIPPIIFYNKTQMDVYLDKKLCRENQIINHAIDDPFTTNYVIVTVNKMDLYIGLAELGQTDVGPFFVDVVRRRYNTDITISSEKNADKKFEVKATVIFPFINISFLASINDDVLLSASIQNFKTEFNLDYMTNKCHFSIQNDKIVLLDPSSSKNIPLLTCGIDKFIDVSVVLTSGSFFCNRIIYLGIILQDIVINAELNCINDIICKVLKLIDIKSLDEFIAYLYGKLNHKLFPATKNYLYNTFKRIINAFVGVSWFELSSTCVLFNVFKDKDRKSLFPKVKYLNLLKRLNKRAIRSRGFSISSFFGPAFIFINNILLEYMITSIEDFIKSAKLIGFLVRISRVKQMIYSSFSESRDFANVYITTNFHNRILLDTGLSVNETEQIELMLNKLHYSKSILSKFLTIDQDSRSIQGAQGFLFLHTYSSPTTINDVYFTFDHLQINGFRIMSKSNSLYDIRRCFNDKNIDQNIRVFFESDINNIYIVISDTNSLLVSIQDGVQVSIPHKEANVEFTSEDFGLIIKSTKNSDNIQFTSKKVEDCITACILIETKKYRDEN